MKGRLEQLLSPQQLARFKIASSGLGLYAKVSTGGSFRMKKKDRERYQLERFQAIFPSFPKGIVIDGQDDGTEPDFFVEHLCRSFPRRKYR